MNSKLQAPILKQIPNYKHPFSNKFQITKKNLKQIPITKSQEALDLVDERAEDWQYGLPLDVLIIGYWDLFVICGL